MKLQNQQKTLLAQIGKIVQLEHTSTSFAVMYVVKNLTNHGTTVFCHLYRQF